MANKITSLLQTWTHITFFMISKGFSDFKGCLERPRL